MAIYLGLDSITQGLTVTAIEVEGPRQEVLFERAIAFDSALPWYGTRRGVLPSEDSRVEHASVYAALPHRYAECEARALNEKAGRSPEPPLSSTAAASR